MISKPFNFLQFLCLLLLSLLVSCEPPGEVQRFVRHSQPKPVNPIVKEILMEDNSTRKVDEFIASPSVKEVKILDSDSNNPGTFKIMVGEWVAQWDSLYSSWFYYNANTDQSTWDKPKELMHISLNPPKGIQPPRKRTGQKGYKQRYQAEDKFIESSQDNFFGFNTANVKDRSLFSGLLESVKYLYESIIEDYLGDVYTDVIEGYTIATIKLIGWFIFGSMLVVKGAVVDHLSASARQAQGREFTSRMFGHSENATATFSLFENFEMTFPIDDSVLTCYKERTSCVENDFPKEFDYLLANIVNMKTFILDWLEFGEKIGHLAVEGGDQF